MRNTLSEDELYMLDQLESGLRSKYGELPKDKKAKIDAFEASLNIIPTAVGRKYAISKFLNTDNDFANQDDFPKLSPELWSVKNQEDYTPPDVEKAEAKKDAEEFWNWDSNKHWTKRNTNELKRRATDAGYSDYNAYLKEVGDIQTRKDREKIYDENAIPGTKLLYPRMTEKVLQGKDIEGKDALLDVGEQVLYAVNPADRLLGAGAGTLAKWGAAAANPLTMESLDALAYRGEDTDRANFSPIDVLVGAGVNRGMDKLTKSLFKNISAPQNVPKQLQTEVSKQTRKTIAANKAKATKDSKEVVSQMLTASKNGEDITPFLNKLKELQAIQTMPNPKKEFRDRTFKDILEEGKKAPAYLAAPFVSNKTGDLLSEDPKRTKRLLRSAVGPAGFMATPVINDVVDAYYGSEEKNKEKKKIDDLIYGLQGR